MRLLVFTAFLAGALGRPTFIAVPADQIAFLDLAPRNVRVPRQALAPPPLSPLEDYQSIPMHELPQRVVSLLPVEDAQSGEHVLAAPKPQRSPLKMLIPPAIAGPSESPSFHGTGDHEQPTDFWEFVDFGAHTGDNGAFGWYADYPLINHDKKF